MQIRHLIIALLLVASCFGQSVFTGKLTGVIPAPSTQVATPTDSPGQGSYSSTQSVTLSDATGSAVICYTTDGSTPAAITPGTCSTGTTYSGAISVSTTTTVKAIGTKSGLVNSTVLTSVYTITTGNTLLFADTFASGDYSLWTGTVSHPQAGFQINGFCPSLASGPISASTAHFTYVINGTCAGTGRDQGAWAEKPLAADETHLWWTATYTEHAPTVGSHTIFTGSKLSFVPSAKNDGSGTNYFHIVPNMYWNGAGQAYMTLILSPDDSGVTRIEDTLIDNSGGPFNGTLFVIDENQSFTLDTDVTLNTLGVSNGAWTATLHYQGNTYVFTHTGLNLRGSVNHGLNVMDMGFQIQVSDAANISVVRDMSLVRVCRNGPC